MWKQSLVILAAIHFATSTYAFSLGSLLPFSPDESVPLGHEDIPPKLQASVQKVASLPPTVSGAGTVMTIPELPELQAGLKLYMANRQTCLQDQARASSFCREETSPNLQTGMQAVNALVGVANVATNENCGTFKKAMTIANGAMTAYTAACGMMRKKCNMSCALAEQGSKQMIQAVVKRAATCVGPNQPACATAMGQYNTEMTAIETALVKEGSITDKKALHYKVNLCKHTYGMLLVSGGLGLAGLVKGIQGGQKCDDDSNGSGGNSSSAGAIAGTGSAEGSGSASSPELAGGGTSSGSASGNTTVGTTDPYSTSSDGRIPTVVSVTPPSEAPRDPSSDGTISRVGAETVTEKSETPVGTESGLRDYLPGGSKAALAVSGNGESHPDITSSGGKSNFEKMRLRFRELGLQN